MEDRGHEAPAVVDRWLKLVNSDGSGLDAYLRPSSIKSVVIDDKDAPTLSIYAGLMTETRRGSGALVDAVVTVTGDEATALLVWLERHTGIMVTATWSRRTDAV